MLCMVTNLNLMVSLPILPDRMDTLLEDEEISLLSELELGVPTMV